MNGELLQSLDKSANILGTFECMLVEMLD